MDEQQEIQRFHSTHNEPFWTSLGKLLRVDTIVSPRLPCQFVSPGDQPKKNEQETKDYNMIVEIIMNKNDRDRVINSLNLFLDRAPKNPNDLVNYVKTKLSYYFKEIKSYGFNHIIILTESCCDGIVFLDCYGRIFELDCIYDELHLYGNYFERIEIAKKNGKYLETWIVEDDGTVVDISDE